MALPRPALLAIAGAMLSMLSFTVMRAIGAEDLPLPAPSAQSAAQPASGGGSQATPPAAKPEPPRLEGVPAPVSKALASGKVVVLLFVEPGAAEDRATARSLRAIGGLRGARPFRVNISKLGDYAGIVANLGITQAPSVVIVRPDLKAVPPIEGYVESGYLVQRVRDQLR